MIKTGLAAARYHWELTRSESSDDDIGYQLDIKRSLITYDIGVTVRWQSGDKERVVALSSVSLMIEK